MTAYIDPADVIVTAKKVTYSNMRQFLNHVDERRVLSFNSNTDLLNTAVPTTVNVVVIYSNSSVVTRARDRGVNPVKDKAGANFGVIGAQSNVLSGATVDLNNTFGVRVGSIWPLSTNQAQTGATIPAEDAFGNDLGFIQP